MEITGTLKAIFDTQQVSDKFKKREFVLTTDAATPYPQHLLIQVTQDKVNLLDQFQIGQEAKVHINLKGREWIDKEGNAKYFNGIEGWKIEAIPTNF